MRVLVDNNVIVDVLKPNPEFEEESRQVLKMTANNQIEGFVSANSMTDIFYVLRKYHGAEAAKTMLRELLSVLDIIGIDPEDCKNALDMPMNDFEDALIAVCAEKIGADCVVTRDESFLKTELGVNILTPRQLIEKVKNVK